MGDIRVLLPVRLTAAVLAVLLLCASPVFAAPTNPRIRAKQAEATSASSKLDDMRTDLEIRVEEYNKINEALHQTRAKIKETQARLDAADARLRQAQALLQRRAEGMYRGGNVDLLAVLLGTASFEDFLTRVDVLSRIGANDAALVAQVKTLRSEVADAKRALEQRAAEQVSLRTQAAAKASEVEDQIAKQKAFVDSLNSEVAKLIKEQQARDEAAARERARRLAEAQKALAEAAKHSGGSRGGRIGVTPSGAGHPEVIAVAMRYIGVPYQWGGTTPSGFDCSGLCQYVYKQLAIDIPRVSQDQYFAGEHIAADRLDLLEPGDLVFFGRGASPDAVHHVGIYAGGDDFIEAPFTGSHVKVSSFRERLDHKEYVGASRF